METPGIGRRAALVCNARSRRGREWFPVVRQTLIDQGWDLSLAEDIVDASKIRPIVEGAIADQVPLVIVGGGDGTMSATAAAFKGHESTMGVLPLGTGNAFARDLGIPTDIEGACRILTEGTPVAIDLGLVQNKHFVNIATCGLTTRIAAEVSNEGKRRLGRFVYVWAIARALAKVRPFQARLIRLGKVETFETLQIVFGSGRFHAGPFPVTPDADITDRWLHGYALKTTHKSDLLRFALSLLVGRHAAMPEVETFKLKQARLETAPFQRLIVDGELGPSSPVELAIDPAAIRVMVGRDF